MKKSFKEIFSEVEFLFKNYSLEFRATVNPYRLEIQQTNNPEYKFDPEDKMIREGLLEHVGMLPVLAIYFYPYINEKVNLGRALEMLAIHDIGELVTGDEIVFTKKKESEDVESKEAIKLLDKKYHDIYLEFNAQKTNDARFAKSIDKIAPDILDSLCDKDMTIKRLKHFANMEPDRIAETIIKFKSPYMQWSLFLKEFHLELMNKLRKKFE